MNEQAAIAFKPRPFGAIVADIMAAVAIGPTPEFLTLLIEQQKQMVRNTARANDPDRHINTGTFEGQRDQLKAMETLLPLQREKWALIRANQAKLRLEKILARHDPAQRRAEIDAINRGFGAKAPTPWQDDMTGVADPNAIGSAE